MTIVYLPIEIKDREMDSRLIIALELLRRGFEVVVGVGHEMIHRHSVLPPGVHLLKGLNAVQCRRMEELATAGSYAVALDEEAFGISNPKYIARDVAPEIASTAKAIFSQGSVQEDALVSFRQIPPKMIYRTGNPRADLLQPPFRKIYETEALKIRETIGNMVLINTNSGSANNVWGDTKKYIEMLEKIGWADTKKPEDQILIQHHLEHDINNVRAVEALVKELARQNPSFRIVLRPHPTEDPAFWIEMAKSISELTVIVGSSAVPWILAADIIVTTGCTTAVEAMLLGKPSVSLISQPSYIDIPSYFLANEISIIDTSAEEAARTVTEFMTGGRARFTTTYDARFDILKNNIDLQGSDWAFQKIAQAIEKIGAPGEPTSGWWDNTAFQEKPSIHKIAWKKAYAPPEEVGEKLGRFLQALGWEFQGQVRRVGFGMLHLTPQV